MLSMVVFHSPLSALVIQDDPKALASGFDDLTLKHAESRCSFNACQLEKPYRSVRLRADELYLKAQRAFRRSPRRLARAERELIGETTAPKQP
jgi:hypothetical protein